MEQKVYQKDDFAIRLDRSLNKLIISAQQTSSSKNFIISFDSNDSIVQMTNDLFGDVDALYDGLVMGLENEDEFITISLSPSALLSYRCIMAASRIKKEYGFNIQLEEVLPKVKEDFEKDTDGEEILLKELRNEMDQKFRLLEEKVIKLEEEKISKLEKKVSDLEKLPAMISEIHESFLQRLDKLEQKIDKNFKLIPKPPEEEKVSTIQHYSGDKIIKKLSTSIIYYALNTKLKENIEIKIKLESQLPKFGIGILKQSHLFNSDWTSSQNCFLFMSDKGFYVGNDLRSPCNLKLKKGNLFTLFVQKQSLILFKDDVSKCSVNYCFKSSDTLILYLVNPNDKIQIISAK